jgi:hypothetical protein
MGTPAITHGVLTVQPTNTSSPSSGISPSGSACVGTCFYVRAGSTGNGSGTDWTNACADFTGSCAVASLVRGATYYVAAGNYGSRTFNTATSGTQTITVKGATVADHGDSTGWNDAYAVGAGSQAHFAYNLIFSGAQYFVFDGNTACGRTGGEACSDPTTYGFTVDQPTSCTSGEDFVYYQKGTVSNDTWAHIALTSCGGATTDIARTAFSDDLASAALSNLRFSYDYCSYMTACIEARKSSGGMTATNINIDHLYSTNAWSSASHHGEQINLVDHVDGFSLTNSVFAGYSVVNGTATVAANDAAPVQPCLNHANIYGNIFVGGKGGNGVIAATNACSIANSNVYNNTFSGNAATWFAGCVTTNCASASGNVAENNIVYNQNAAIGAGVATHDYNSYFSDSNVPSEPNRQTSASNPFVNTAAGDYHLAVDTSPWNLNGMPAGDNVDPDGITRTSSRGTFQFH